MKISMILDKVDENQLFVPAFQREYVWKREDAKLLMDSLIKGYPTGTMLTWETNNPPELKGGHVYDERQGAVRILLDGQQRVTTLYMLVKGELPPYYTLEEIANDTRGLYVHVETLELEYYSKIRMENEPRWVDITDVFNKKIKSWNLIKNLEARGEGLTGDQVDLIQENFALVLSILDRDFPEQTVPVKATIREAIDIFYKVNAGGVALTDAELALAQISGYWPQARERFKAKLDKLEQDGFSFKLDFVVYVLLGVLHHNGSDMRKLHADNNDDALRAAWEKLDNQVLDYAANLLRSFAYVDHTYEINSIYALVPIIVHCYDRDCDLSQTEVLKIVKWFYYSQVRRRYVSQLPQKLDYDLKIVAENSSPFDRLLDVIREERGGNISIAADEFEGRAIQHPLFSLMRWHLKSRGAKCLTTGVKIQKPMGDKYQLENDHIFPYSRLKAAGYGMDNRIKYSLAQELTNRAILTQVANRTKGAVLANDYLSDVQGRFPNALKLQLIPEDHELWEIENYELFLKTRRKILADSLNTWLEGIVETISMDGKVTLEDLIADGENEDLEFKETFRWDVRQETVNKDLENVILKTIAAFSNALGGRLLIGVTDDGEVVGLERDYKSLGGGGKDKFELHLTNLVQSSFGQSFAATKVTVTFPEVSGVELCSVEIRPANKATYLRVSMKGGPAQERFYVRSGNSSPELPLSEAKAYIDERFV
ncbi:DUF262 domain-containing protein [Pararhizobium sp. IMCC21322]|uniref:GmrSD restriction endonuclease domain-containing protein n=1 Tax=Pararhizobium sp. IMCC21322 TaxID=3067903 RepID=UPI002740F312|nr:DUF262 domain-containing protein [Pararhizobium sp. IMCC21322]